MCKSLFVSAVLLFGISWMACGQITQEDKIREQQMAAEAARSTMISRMIDEGVDRMEMGEYEAANTIFRDVLEKARVVPTDLTYFFGKNSYFLGKFQQSVDWLTKYVELKGTKGQYYEDCLNYLDKARAEVRKEKAVESDNVREILTSDYEIDCGPSGMVICPVCKGRTVIIKKGPLGTTYQECPYSDKHGYLTCEQYNQLLRGELEPRN